MINRIKNKLKLIFLKKEKTRCMVKKNQESSFIKGNNVVITNSIINLSGKSNLVIHDNVSIDGYNINLKNGSLVIGENSHLIRGRQYINPDITIDQGNLIIGANNIVKASFSIRFNGSCSIGTYNAINEETEIRCDQSIIIGSHNMISYQCMIYDTNTHCIYPPAIRRAKTEAEYPYIGIETEKPKTAEVIIGDDNWLGRQSVILKGCQLGNQVIVGTHAVVANLKVDKVTLVGNPAYVVNKS